MHSNSFGLLALAPANKPLPPDLALWKASSGGGVVAANWERIRTLEMRKATVKVVTSNEQHLINYMDYKILGIETLLLLDYHILDQVFDFEEGDESVCISHMTFGMESGTEADGSNRGRPAPQGLPRGAAVASRRQA